MSAIDVSVEGFGALVDELVAILERWDSALPADLIERFSQFIDSDACFFNATCVDVEPESAGACVATRLDVCEGFIEFAAALRAADRDLKASHGSAP